MVVGSRLIRCVTPTVLDTHITQAPTHLTFALRSCNDQPSRVAPSNSLQPSVHLSSPDTRMSSVRSSRRHDVSQCVQQQQQLSCGPAVPWWTCTRGQAGVVYPSLRLLPQHHRHHPASHVVAVCVCPACMHSGFILGFLHYGHPASVHSPCVSNL